MSGGVAERWIEQPALRGPVLVPVDPPVHRRLQRLAARTGRSPAELVGEALAEYAERRLQTRLPSWVGAARPRPEHGGPP